MEKFHSDVFRLFSSLLKNNIIQSFQDDLIKKFKTSEFNTPCSYDQSFLYFYVFTIVKSYSSYRNFSVKLFHLLGG